MKILAWYFVALLVTPFAIPYRAYQHLRHRDHI